MVLYASGESWFQDRNLKAVNCMTMSEIILAIVFLETTIWTTARKGCNQSMLPSGGSFNFRTTITPPQKKKRPQPAALAIVSGRTPGSLDLSCHQRTALKMACLAGRG